MVYHSTELYPSRTALWLPKSGTLTYGELGGLIRQTQALLRKLKVGPGDSVLLLDLPGPLLYAATTAIVGLGATVLLVEPWLPVERLNHIIDSVKPKIFWSPFLGQIWASRIAQIRKIPHWIRPRSVLSESSRDPFTCIDVDPDQSALLSFSSGTSGQPKGIPRTHRYIEAAVDVIKKLPLEPDPKPTMAIFPNLALLHLSQGRSTLLVPSKWPEKVLDRIGAMTGELAPRTTIGGPAFLRKLIATKGFESLEWIGVGGALLDCDLLEQAMKRFPKAQFELIYGSTEVEPVAHALGKEALSKCRDNKFFQIVYLGHAVEEITMKQTDDALWVTGPHVTREYVQASHIDHALKQRDAEGRIWHNMGDRIEIDPKDQGLWYRGRTFQKAEDFDQEQRIYWLLQSSASFIVRNSRNQPVLVGECVSHRKAEILKAFPDLLGVYETKIVRDIRHRSRIDRKASLAPLLKTIEKTG